LTRCFLKAGRSVGFATEWDLLVKRDLDFPANISRALKDIARRLIQMLLLFFKPDSIRAHESLLESEPADGHRDHYDAQSDEKSDHPDDASASLGRFHRNVNPFTKAAILVH